MEEEIKEEVFESDEDIYGDETGEDIANAPVKHDVKEAIEESTNEVSD